MYALNFDALKRKLEQQEDVQVQKLVTTWFNSPEFDVYYNLYNEYPHIQFTTEEDNITYTFYWVKKNGSLVLGDLTKQ